MESALFSLAVLACPVGMGLMMWFMMRGQKMRHSPPSPAELRAEQVRLTQQIDELERREYSQPVARPR